MSLKDKIALVTGASRGIGKAIAHDLAKQGAQVIGTATTEQGAEAITQAFKDASLNGVGRCLNVSDTDQIEAFVKMINDEFGGVDILINNAGITRDNLFIRMKPNEWHDLMNTNLNSLYWLTKPLVRGMMKKRWGRIINITSVVGATGSPGQTNYSAAKAGVIGFTKSLAQELASRGVTVNAIAPGYIETDMTGALSEEYREIILSKIPMGKAGCGDDIATTVSFLSSEGAGYITGQTIHVNGGMFMS